MSYKINKSQWPDYSYSNSITPIFRQLLRMATLPNVSTIYRDLAFMAQGPTRHHEAPPQAPAYSQPVQQYGSKQARHNELMEKLRNAQMQCGGLNREIGGSQTVGNNATTRHYQPTQIQSYQPQTYQTQYQGKGWGSRTEGKWQPPPMRYRHIEDFKPAQEHQEAVQHMIQKAHKAALQKEFYQDQRQKQAESPPKQRPSAVEAEQAPGQDRFDGVSETSYGRTWANRESKFQDKLESYYELCKRRPVSSKADPNGDSSAANSRNKYMRTPNRNNVVELDKAIKILSYD